MDEPVGGEGWAGVRGPMPEVCHIEEDAAAVLRRSFGAGVPPASSPGISPGVTRHPPAAKRFTSSSAPPTAAKDRARRPRAQARALPGSSRSDPGDADSPFRLALVDDDGGVRFAVREMIRAQAGGWRLDEYSGGHEALTGMRATPPDVVLMDMWMPGLSGLDCTRKLKAALPDLPVIMFTACQDPEGILLSLMAGACGYLIKPVAAPDLVEAVSRAAQGWPALCPVAERALLSSLRRPGAGATPLALSEREQQVMAGLIQKLSNKEIAQRLNLAPNTVHVHLAGIFRKLGAHGRREAVMKFLLGTGGAGKGRNEVRRRWGRVFRGCRVTRVQG